VHVKFTPVSHDNMKIPRLKFCSLIFTISVFTACSASVSPQREMQRTSQSSGWEVEVETITDQAIAEILNTPTEFVVSFPDDHHSWERAMLFLDKHTTRKSVQHIMDPEELLIVSNYGETRDSYWYNIEKISHPEGWLYRIRAVPALSGNHQLADRNARNLARFIRNGILERSLIAH